MISFFRNQPVADARLCRLAVWHCLSIFAQAHKINVYPLILNIHATYPNTSELRSPSSSWMRRVSRPKPCNMITVPRAKVVESIVLGFHPISILIESAIRTMKEPLSRRIPNSPCTRNTLPFVISAKEDTVERVTHF